MTGSKYLLIFLCLILLQGCTTTYAKKDQLMLIVPEELLTPPKQLQEL